MPDPPPGTTPPCVAVAALIDEFLTAKIAENRSEATIRAYRQRLLRFQAWLGERPLCRATLRGYLAQLHDDQALSPTTRAGYFRDVAIWCRWLVEEGQLVENPARKLVPKTPKRRPASYRTEHVQALLAVADLREREIILTLCDTGLRASELVSLRRSSIDWGSGFFSVVGKGDKERVGWISPPVVVAIRAYLQTRSDDRDALWWGKKGALKRDGVHQLVQRLARRAGIRDEVRRLMHSFRVTFAKNYIKRGGDLKSLADLLGHTTLTMAAHYAQLVDDELCQKKAAINPLAAILDPLDS